MYIGVIRSKDRRRISDERLVMSVPTTRDGIARYRHYHTIYKYMYLDFIRSNTLAFSFYMKSTGPQIGGFKNSLVRVRRDPSRW